LSVANDIVKLAIKELQNRTCKCSQCAVKCSNDCKGCLEDIHMKGDLRRYDCNFMRSYYLVSYLYKYKKKSEQGFLIEQKKFNSI
jgi:hypothetical protein